jgi:predicted Ser/Thr protein kinase
VFAELVYDTDRNQGNILITEDWKMWMIDFTRAFRLDRELQEPKNLTRCERKLLEKLRQLNGDELLEKTKPHLGKSEVKAVMARRDKIVAYFDKAVAERGEAAVLY